jgi:general secretion pathway protein L
MGKRFIGIDFDDRCVRVAILTEEKGRNLAVSVDKRTFADDEERLQCLLELIGRETRLGDRLAAALPARDGFIRQLSFPFADPRKIAAALELELGAQLPVAVETCTSDFQRPLADDDNSWNVTAAAVRTEVVRDFLAPLDAAGFVLSILDLDPFAYAAGLADLFPDGLLVTTREQSITIALLQNGRVASYRLLPVAATLTEDDRSQLVQREGAALQGAAGCNDLPLCLIGPAASPALIERLERSGVRVEKPTVVVDERPVDREFMPAVALARRAATTERGDSFNFRRGPFAPKSEWVALKRWLAFAATLLILSGLALGAAAWLNYSGKASRAEALNQEMVRLFQETFPRESAIVNVPLQMRGKINELQKKIALYGADSSRSALAVLREISTRLPEDLVVDIRELSYTPESIMFEGSTASFDAVNRLAKALEQSPHFRTPQVADAKMSLDGSRVDFRLNLTFSEEKSQ